MSVPCKVGRGEEEQVTRPASPSQSRLDYNAPTPNCKVGLASVSRSRRMTRARTVNAEQLLVLLQFAARGGVALDPADGPIESTQQALLEIRVAPGFTAMAHRRVEHLALAAIVAPRDGVIAVLAGVVRLERVGIDAQDDVQVVAAEGLLFAFGRVAEDVPLVEVVHAVAEALGAGVLGIFDLNADLLLSRVRLKESAEQVAVAGGVERIGTAVRGDKGMALLHPLDQVFLLGRGHGLAGGEEHHD